MSYQIFARKFRPQSFEEVVGQDPISTTLQNAIKQERIPQSFLFSGPRGVGKTSTARILAKALNCAKGPTAKPCNKCDSCKEITEGNSLDVLEIDGASNRGIDEIRNLRETVKFKPTSGRFKVYIIDEVHMLTTEAFNALLKTLEEPPAHVKFIFATTESHKVPLTILSRCQRFNFKRITVPETVEKLEEIAKKEKIKFEKNALFLIAKASEGALRDAESLLDQLSTFSKDKIKEKDVLSMLGLASDAIYFEILTCLKSKDVAKIFKTIRSFYEEGGDLVYFAKGLLENFRHLLVLKSAQKGESFIELGESSIEELKNRKNDFSQGELLLALSILQNLQGHLRRNLAPPKLLVETALLKLLHMEGLHKLEDLATSPANVATTTSGYRTAAAQKKSLNKPAAQTPSAPAGTPEPSKSRSAKADSAESNINIDEAESFWPRVIDYVKSKRMSIGVFLSEAEPVEINDSTVVLGLPSEFQFHKESLEKDASRQLVEEAFEVVGGKKVRVQFVVTEVSSASAEKSSEDAAPISAASGDDKSKMNDVIMDAMDVFGGAKVVRKD